VKEPFVRVLIIVWEIRPDKKFVKVEYFATELSITGRQRARTALAEGADNAGLTIQSSVGLTVRGDVADVGSVWFWQGGMRERSPD
jgi:hypothetical protein